MKKIGKCRVWNTAYNGGDLIELKFNSNKQASEQAGRQAYTICIAHVGISFVCLFVDDAAAAVVRNVLWSFSDIVYIHRIC